MGAVVALPTHLRPCATRGVFMSSSAGLKDYRPGAAEPTYQNQCTGKYD
jgi:hypothetical protein